MADTVTSQVIYSGTRNYIALFTCISDGTGETNVKKVDLDDLLTSKGKRPSSVSIEEIVFDVMGFDSLTISWDRSPSPRTAIVLRNVGNCELFNFSKKQPLHDPDRDQTLSTGNILFTTAGATSGDMYSVLLTLKLKD